MLSAETRQFLCLHAIVRGKEGVRKRKQPPIWRKARNQSITKSRVQTKKVRVILKKTIIGIDKWSKFARKEDAEKKIKRKKRTNRSHQRGYTWEFLLNFWHRTQVNSFGRDKNGRKLSGSYSFQVTPTREECSIPLCSRINQNWRCRVWIVNQ